MRIIFCATHPKACNGYSKVAYELCNRLGAREDVELFWFGFQNVDPKPRNSRPLPERIEVYDAMAKENPKKNGFGFELIEPYVRKVEPDIVIIYNDAVVCSQIMKKLDNIKDRKFKIIVYQDQVYEHMKKIFIDMLNTHADRVITFTPYWADVLVSQGVTKPVSFLRHGFNPDMHYPIPKDLARRYFRISPNEFVILNLNRNQPRKRWDIVIKSFAEFVSRFKGEPFKLLVGTSVNGSWNLIELYERELKKRGVSLEDGMKHLMLIDSPQKLSDEDVNILMNCADIGISAADGEGFGLCNFEQGGIGIPQVVPRLGGFIDFFDDNSVYFCDPVLHYYVDTSRDGVGGEAQLIDYSDLTKGIEFYYNSSSKRKEHGRAIRNRLLKDYKWDDIEQSLYETCQRTLGITVTIKEEPDLENQVVQDMISEDVDADADAHDQDADADADAHDQDDLVSHTIEDEDGDEDTKSKDTKVIEITESKDYDNFMCKLQEIQTQLNQLSGVVKTLSDIAPLHSLSSS
ncbi:glycosyltransferase [Tetraselmis virus 1]|uniref:Glycosyltransferase n=1 Tax=Tetraselmis virus 1 TaxID=2060617 RepID=A0A2P0VN72_9VIRU|nr:glycosyltransferase [Tetraselmis virus 1]AUF82333.1 glycosyltransferase [Tetraselmis virus 1]